MAARMTVSAPTRHWPCCARSWALHRLNAASQPKNATLAARNAKAAKTATKKVALAAPKVEAKAPSKKDAVLAMISQKSGATLAEIMAATGWQSLVPFITREIL
jgi:hypothetical protein